jgi:hypothetical protein
LNGRMVEPGELLAEPFREFVHIPVTHTVLLSGILVSWTADSRAAI